MAYKRAVDIGLLVLLSPLILFCLIGTSFVVYIFDGSPIFFLQKRSGYKGISFTIWKFRTMRGAEPSMNEMDDDSSRITSVGRFLRASGLDELPQIINILKGEMSFVGPRPLVVDHQDLMTKTELRRLSVLPGITGWAQINGRNSISWQERSALDLWYVEHQTLGLDVLIILRTFRFCFRSLLNKNEESGIIPAGRGRDE